jgi:hypothetical protein
MNGGIELERVVQIGFNSTTGRPLFEKMLIKMETFPYIVVIVVFLLSFFLPLTCFLTDFLLGLFFDPEDGGDIFLRNICCLSMDCTTLYPRR